MSSDGLLRVRRLVRGVVHGAWQLPRNQRHAGQGVAAHTLRGAVHALAAAPGRCVAAEQRVSSDCVLLICLRCLEERT